jgi:hypothetical protein
MRADPGHRQVTFRNSERRIGPVARVAAHALPSPSGYLVWSSATLHAPDSRTKTIVVGAFTENGCPSHRI